MFIPPPPPDVDIALFHADASMRALLRLVFDRWGYLTVAAPLSHQPATLDAFADVLRRYRPQVVVYDLAPPYRPAWALVQAVQEEDRTPGEDRAWVLTTTDLRALEAEVGSVPVVEIARDVSRLTALMRAVGCGLRARPEITVQSDAAGTIAAVSAGVTRTTGRDAETLRGQPVQTFGLVLVHPDDRAHVATTLDRRQCPPGSARKGHCRLQHRDGSWREAAFTFSNLLHEPGIGRAVLRYRYLDDAPTLEKKPYTMPQLKQYRAMGAKREPDPKDCPAEETSAGRPMAWHRHGDDNGVTRLQPEQSAMSWVRPTLVLSAMPLFLLTGRVVSILFG